MRVNWCTAATQDVLYVEFALGMPSVNIFLFVDFAPLPLSSPRVNFSFLSCLGVHEIHDINYGVIAVDI